MHSVYIVGNVAAATIGEGWKDKIQAAHTYAGFLHREIASACKLKELPAEVLINVSENGEGTSFQVGGGDVESKTIAESIIATTEPLAWEKFITSEQAGFLASN